MTGLLKKATVCHDVSEKGAHGRRSAGAGSTDQNTPLFEAACRKTSAESWTGVDPMPSCGPAIRIEDRRIRRGNACIRARHLFLILVSFMIFLGCQNNPAEAEQPMLEAVLEAAWPVAGFSLQYTEEHPLDHTLEIQVDEVGHITTTRQTWRENCSEPTDPACWESGKKQQTMTPETLKYLVRSLDRLQRTQIPFQPETFPGVGRFSLGISVAEKRYVSATGPLSDLDRYPLFDDLRRQLLTHAGVSAHPD